MEKPAVGTRDREGSVGDDKVQMKKKKLKVHEARHTAIGTGKAAAAIDNLQMDKAPTETGNAVAAMGDMIQTEKIGAQSDPPVGKHRIPDDQGRSQKHPKAGAKTVLVVLGT
jgi:hypothetical protein